MRAVDPALETRCINTIRTLAIDTVQKANSGHPGLPLGAAPMAYVLWQHHLRHNPRNPLWPDRDRFVLSPGHGSALLYALLHLTGYDVGLEDLEAFRQWGSRTPGHPEYRMTAGVEATTGPLGQGSSNAVGMAMAERILAHRFNRPGHAIVDHRTYAIVSDGDLMEGISAEASSLAGHLGLGKLTFLYDCNHVSLDGPTTLAFSREDVAARYRAYGWQVLEIEEGDTNTAAIDAALSEAEADTTRPSLLVIKTTIGYGSPNKAGTSAAHGSPLGVEEVRLTKEALGMDPDRQFFLPEEVVSHFRTAIERGQRAQTDWDQRFTEYAHAYPDLAAEWQRTMRGELPQGWDAGIPVFGPADAQATRQAGGKVMNAIARHVPAFMGGDADLSVSTGTSLKGAGSFDAKTGGGSNLHFGVREHAMTGIANGIAYHGGARPFVSTFFVFSDYMRPSVRLAALSKLPLICVWTHDSIAVGEDGPTHQPVEHLMAWRIVPNFVLLRPCDPNETAEAWRWTMQYRGGPVGIVLSRQTVPVIDRERYAPASGLARGAYILADTEAPQAILLATGAEVHVALAAHEQLLSEGVPTRIVSMPSWEIFEQQDEAYRNSVLPPEITARVSIEAGVTLGWSRWIGNRGVAIGIDRFGASAPGEVNLEKYGISTGHVLETVRKLL